MPSTRPTAPLFRSVRPSLTPLPSQYKRRRRVRKQAKRSTWQDLISLDGYFVQLFLRMAPTLLVLCKTTVVADMVVFSWCSDALRSSHVSRNLALIWSGSLTFCSEFHSGGCSSLFSSRSAHSSAHEFTGFMNVFGINSSRSSSEDMATFWRPSQREEHKPLATCDVDPNNRVPTSRCTDLRDTSQG